MEKTRLFKTHKMFRPFHVEHNGKTYQIESIHLFSNGEELAVSNAWFNSVNRDIDNLSEMYFLGSLRKAVKVNLNSKDNFFTTVKDCGLTKAKLFINLGIQPTTYSTEYTQTTEMRDTTTYFYKNVRFNAEHVLKGFGNVEYIDNFNVNVQQFIRSEKTEFGLMVEKKRQELEKIGIKVEYLTLATTLKRYELNIKPL